MLLKFIEERFPIKVTIPLVIIITMAPQSLIPLKVSDTIICNITSFFSLFLLRLADDISDIKIDRILHPQRWLVNVEININKIRITFIISIILLIIINVFSLYNILVLLFLIVYYSIFFKIKSKIPAIVQPILINIIFLILPIYINLLSVHNITKPYILLGLFIWIAVIAHDFAHSIHGFNEQKDIIKTLSTQLGPHNVALIAFILYWLSFIVGILFWFQFEVSYLFVVLLIITFVYINFLCIKLLKKPDMSSAKQFYINGFLFFLIPLIGLIINNLYYLIK